MTGLLHSVWENILGPLLQRPKRIQVAALCHRENGADKEVLLVTSRDTGRWIIPKGWPIRGLQSSEAALQEAWEEAGVCNSAAASDPIGTYSYDKVMKAGLPIPINTLVYSVEVEDTTTTYPESHQRERKWVSFREAANLVKEPELKSIFRNMA